MTIVVPHFRGDVVLSCLNSIYSDTTRPMTEVVVVDDGPGDPAVFAQIASNFPQARVVRARGSSGFGAAANVGVKHASLAAAQP